MKHANHKKYVKTRDRFIRGERLVALLPLMTTRRVIILFLVFLLGMELAKAEDIGDLKGRVKGINNRYLEHARIELNPGNFTTTSDKDGIFIFNKIPFGTYSLTVAHIGFKAYEGNIKILRSEDFIEVRMKPSPIDLEEIEVIGSGRGMNGLTFLKDVSGTDIYTGKKNEVIELDKIDGNAAVNNSREIFSKVSGLNIWENDGSGIQTNISVRGVSPNRSWELNNRQNGYNIQADVLGYPDTYYTPPLEAVESIELVRGAGALLYGTQLGGMINYNLKKGNPDKPISVELLQTRGSYNLFNSYNGVGGKIGKVSYYGYYHHRSADGWRQNSDYKWNTAYGLIKYEFTDNLSVSAEMTHMKYLLHLSAGLTDSLYKVNHRASTRDRNWFEVEWLLPALIVDYQISPKLKFNARNYLLIGRRNSIEHTVPVNMPDDMRPRDLRKDTYLNFTSEAKFLYTYNLDFMQENALSVGVRFYDGRTTRGQGLGTDERDANFSFLNPNNLEYSDYQFFSNNIALYVENIFRLTDKLSVTPGFRYEWVDMSANGYYNAKGVRSEDKNIKSYRKIPLFGIGAEYDINRNINLYANYSQGYRAIHFNELRVTNPNLVIDGNMKDSEGFNTDIGLRGKLSHFLNFDVTAFYLGYNNKVGVVTRKDENGNDIQYSTNISSSRNIGLESFFEFNILKLKNINSRSGLSLFVTYSYLDARYINAENKDIEDKKVESAPANILRSGITYKMKNFSSTLNFSFVDKQFSDATNTRSTITGNNGLIPQYEVVDWSSSYKYKNFRIALSVNNLLNKKYATRRATAYPGPGLIPGEARTINVTLGVKI